MSISRHCFLFCMPHNLTVSSNGKQLTDIWRCSVLLSYKYAPRASVKEIRLKGKLQLYLAGELASCCSQVMGHVCTPPSLKLTAAGVDTVITEVRHKSQSKRLEKDRGREKEDRERRIAWGPEEALTLKQHTIPSRMPPSHQSCLLSFFLFPHKHTLSLRVYILGHPEAAAVGPLCVLYWSCGFLIAPQ